MEVLDTLDTLLVESSLVRRVVEVQVPSEDLVTALTTEHHLDAHSLDLAREQVHGRRGADGGDIVRLQVVDDIRQSVKTLVDGEGHDVMLGTQELGHLEGSLVVGRARQTD